MINLSVYLSHLSGFFNIFCVLSSVLSEVVTIFMIISSLLHGGFLQFSCWVKFLNRGYSSWILLFSLAQVLVHSLAVFVQVWWLTSMPLLDCPTDPQVGDPSDCKLLLLFYIWFLHIFSTVTRFLKGQGLSGPQDVLWQAGTCCGCKFLIFLYF